MSAVEKHNEVIRLLEQSFKNGGEEVVVRSTERNNLWEVIVMKKDDVYFSYTVGKDNSTFLLSLFELLREKGFQ